MGATVSNLAVTCDMRAQGLQLLWCLLPLCLLFSAYTLPCIRNCDWEWYCWLLFAGGASYSGTVSGPANFSSPNWIVAASTNNGFSDASPFSIAYDSEVIVYFQDWSVNYPVSYNSTGSVQVSLLVSQRDFT